MYICKSTIAVPRTKPIATVSLFGRVCSRRCTRSCHRSTDTNKMPQKLYIAAGYWIRCVLGGEGASRPLPPNPPPPLKPSQAKLSQANLLISQAIRLNLPDSPPSLWPSQPDSTPSRAGPLSLTVSLSGTDTAKPSPNHFFQGDHVI